MKKILVILMSVCLILFLSDTSYADKNISYADENIPEACLISAGMPVDEVASMDPDFRDYIGTSLLTDSSENSSWEYIPVITGNPSPPRLQFTDTPYADKMTPADYLISAGMPADEANSMDPDFRDYIAASLLTNSSENTSWEYIPVTVNETEPSRSLQPLTGVSYSAYAFKNGNIISIYPTYEFTSPKRPRGDDAFAYAYGDAFQAYEFGGALWSKASASDPWTAAPGVLVANLLGLNFALYSGLQLGCPDSNMYFKGCTYCKALAGAGTDKRIVLSYLYNPNSTNYSFSVSYGLGISYTPSGTAYSSAQTFNLSY